MFEIPPHVAWYLRGSVHNSAPGICTSCAQEDEPTVSYSHEQQEEMRVAHGDAGRGITTGSPATSSMDFTVSVAPNFGTASNPYAGQVGCHTRLLHQRRAARGGGTC